MRPSNLLSLLVASAVADIAIYTADNGIVAPFPVIEDRAVNCKALNGVLSALKGLGKPVTTFCSSYLQIGTTTVTSVITPPPSIVTVVSATTVTVTTFAFTGFRKRSAPRETIVRPAALQQFAAAELTSACKCLSLPTPATTLTITLPTQVNTITALTTLTTTFTTCAAAGMHCECNNPGACCGFACSCNGSQGPVSTCI